MGNFSVASCFICQAGPVLAVLLPELLGLGAAVGRVSPPVTRRCSPAFASSLGADLLPHLPPTQMRRRY